MISFYKDFKKSLDPKIESEYVKFRLQIDNHKNKTKTLHPINLSRIQRAAKFLTDLQKMRVVGFNSEKYDLVVLQAALFKVLSSHGWKFDLIKRGQGIFSVHVDNHITFLDVRNFTAGGSLDTFCKTFDAALTKGCFPYEKYISIKDARNDNTWPPISHFNSHLKRPIQVTKDVIKKVYTNMRKTRSHENIIHLLNLDSVLLTIDSSDPNFINFDLKSEIVFYPICPLLYADNFDNFNFLLNEKIIKNMFDFYQHYCELDTKCLLQAFSNYIGKFWQEDRSHPLEFLSLPGLAEDIMWNSYNADINSPYSFHTDYTFVNKLIRENLRGGLTAVFHRHIELDNDKRSLYQPSVTEAINGRPFIKAKCYDFSSKFSD